ncbi:MULTISPECIES: TldD/PmbA family protein [unclassified Coleofasciculus]|uniref:TldD/PmbA family protein n=1 Tax=unclassified Coleofasciculus TaxID=2692782 RepID=UPI001882BA08|nr:MULTISPECIES: TldD/PmbA family protein [unclassified Coleofasciculus]MBE9129165.1 TldD/PmbA family protein [Coleofasciculus sp. LEGE 07081]MBE9151824.1 TldD/PmbA family protein [Coleofasciculus sp. LEGE 07092]
MTLATAPTLLSEDQALSLVDSVIQQSQAEGVFVNLSASESSLSRFSENQISQNISRNRFNLTITSYFGKRSASASTTELDPEAIAQTIRRSEELARIAPEDPEWVPLLEPQVYEQRRPTFDEATATLSPLVRGEMVQGVCAMSTKAGVEGSGTLSIEAFSQALGNSQGLRASDRGTKAEFSFTARIDNGSSWSQRTAFAVEQLPLDSLTEQLIERAIASRHPREIKPDTYPVVFDGAAFADLLPWVIWNLDARAADEGRSFMSRTDEAGKPVANRVGESMFSSLVQVQRHPAHPLLQLGTYFSDGLSNDYLEVVKDGVPEILSYSRYWAQQQGKEPTGKLFPIVMSGSDQSLADLIAQTELGILVSRAWYVRYINPRTLEVTGMTRDGTFWIEEGKVAYPIKNLRFNQSLPDMLRDVDALSRVQRFGSSVVPGVRVKAFNFSSVTDSV